MRRLLRYMRPYSGYVAISLAFLLLQSLLQILGPLLTKVAIDRYLDPHSPRAANILDRRLAAAPPPPYCHQSVAGSLPFPTRTPPCTAAVASRSLSCWW